MDVFVRQLQFGVNQSDFVGRNVVLASDPDSTTTSGGLSLPRVVLIDYNTAIVNTAPYEQGHSLLPESPIRRFWNAYLWEDFRGWAPHEWKDIGFQRRWLVQIFNGDDQRQLYLPLPEPIAREVHESYEAEHSENTSTKPHTMVKKPSTSTAGGQIKEPFTSGWEVQKGAPCSGAVAASFRRSETISGSPCYARSSSRISSPPILLFGLDPGTFRIFDPDSIRTPEAVQKEHLDHLAAKKKKQLPQRPAAPTKQPDITKKK
jgi:hypothetical protein